MNAVDVLIFLGRIGYRFTPSTALLARNYFYEMIRDGRITALYKDGVIHGILAFSLCTDYEAFWKKETWDYRPHQIDGTTLYVELMAARNWNKEVRQAFQQEILKLHPQVEQAVWHKWAAWGDRKVTWRRQWAMK